METLNWRRICLGTGLSRRVFAETTIEDHTHTQETHKRTYILQSLQFGNGSHTRDICGIELSIFI